MKSVVIFVIVVVFVFGIVWHLFNSQDPVIVAVGDIACEPSHIHFNNGEGIATKCRQMYTANIAESIDPTAILLLGDIQYPNGSYEDFVQSFEHSWGKMKSIMYPAPGNHEYNIDGAKDYYDYFGELAGDRTKGYYSFDIDSWHIISLNSNCSIVSCNETSAQAQWLENDLIADDSQCIIAYWHHPRFNVGVSSGEDDTTDYLWRLLEKYNADIVLAGHSHNYQRYAPVDPSGTSDPQGIRQFIVGTGGFDHHSNLTPSLHSTLEKYDSSTFGVLKMTLHNTSYDWEFIGEDGTSFTDSGTGYCN